MALLQCHWFSKCLMKAVQTMVLVPDHGEPPFPTFYLLHGLSDDATTWCRRTSLERYQASAAPMVIVMPDGFRGFYTNTADGIPYAKYIGEELVAWVERNLAVRADRESRAIGGLSMGGYGALRVGLAYADRFASINSHSGALLRGHVKPEGWEQSVFGSSPTGTDHDLAHLARRALAGGNLPRIRIDCGVDDFLIQHNREMVKILRELGVELEYEEFPGAHDWPYWDTHIKDALRFHAESLGLKT